MVIDEEHAYRVCSARDARFDGCFIHAVRTTGIYCRPSCPAVTPKRRNSQFFLTAAAAQSAGFRACRRCLPDAVPGSPEWDLRADLAGRAMRLISDGIVERDGVTGLATRLGYSERHLTRVLTAELGAGPLALARAHRAHAARLLIETTELPFADIAFAAGFASVRQFNDTIRMVFASTPSDMRGRGKAPAGTPGRIVLRLPYRAPFDATGLLAHFRTHALAGVEEVTADSYARTLSLPHGEATVRLTFPADHVLCSLRLADVRDLGAAVSRVRRLLDLDADPAAVDEFLGADPIIGPLVRETPGIRVAGSVDGAETLLRLVAPFTGVPLQIPDGNLTHLYAAGDHPVTEALANGRLVVDVGRSIEDLTGELTPLTGPAVADEVAMRVLGAPDVLVLPRASRHLTSHGPDWRPWRSYAGAHLTRKATTS
ncbi:bifunctional transcriptional activator/DNA repair enzyme AdaA [Lentzea californiensis]|uniref:bifunctional transcriptional activator/DNA repair enzyme AdaA n=1 Tax=Lentzea californiensis TaxID=438851 RepID=UPI0021641464|nr:AlkA N-terminal domain-containing protein [Lentzea californiensis]MCR3747939.1 DNA-3-methyladenine glycosylase II [Lentzea californiensis]